MTARAAPGHKNKGTQPRRRAVPAPRDVVPLAQPLSPYAVSVQLAVADPRRAVPADLLAVQRMAGNRAAVRLLQPLSRAGMQRRTVPRVVRDRDEQAATLMARMAASSMSLLQPRGLAPSNQVQRAAARAITNAPVYQVDSGAPDRVAVRLGRKTRSGTAIPRYTHFDVADQPAANAPQYFKLESPGYGDGYVHRPKYQLERPSAGRQVVKIPTHIKDGSELYEARVGDVVQVSARTDTYWIATNRRTGDGPGTINRQKVRDRSDGLEKTGAPTKIYVAVQPTTMYEGLGDRNETVGVSQQEVVLLQPGDKLKVNADAPGMDSAGNVGTWVYAEAIDPAGRRGYVDRAAVQKATPRAKAPGTNLVDAVSRTALAAFYKPRSPNRNKSIGVAEVRWRFGRSSAPLKADFGAAGYDAQGRPSLVFAHSLRRGQDGYVVKSHVRNVQETIDKLGRQVGGAGGGQAGLEGMPDNVIVTQKTKLREIRESGGIISLWPTLDMNPGMVLESTAHSRFVVLEDRPWFTDMSFAGSRLGLVDKEKANRLSADEYRGLKLGISQPQELKRVRVTEDTHLRQIVGGRRHSVEVGDRVGDEIKKDEIVSVDASIRGADEGFSMAWIAARTRGRVVGYIRKEKVTPEAVKTLRFAGGAVGKAKGWFGKQKTVDLSGRKIEGNEIPQGSEYVATVDRNVGQGTKVGDRFTPTRDAVATEDTYWQLENRRTGRTWNVGRENVMLASPALIKNPPQPGTTVILTDVAGLHEPKVDAQDRASNVGVSIKRKEGENLQAGDKVEVDFEAGGVDRKGDAAWAYARTLDGRRQGYVRTSKVRESAAEMLEAAAGPRGVPDRFVPAYVTSKTQLRDDKGKKTGEKKDVADQVLVKFRSHPPRQITRPAQGRQAAQQIPNPYYAAGGIDKWILVKGKPNEERYIWEYKVTVASAAFERKAVEQEGGSRAGNAYEAAKMLLGLLKETAYESAGGWGVGTTGDIATNAQEGLGWSWWPDAPTVGYEEGTLAGAGALGSLLGLMGCAEGLRDLVKGGGVKQRLRALLKVAQTGLGTTTAFTQAVIHGKGGDDWTGDTADQWKAAAGWSAGIANAITSVKALFLTLNSWFRERKKKGMDRFLEGAHHLLEAGASGVKSAKFITDTFDISGASQLALSVPFLGLAVDLASIVLGFRKWWVSSTAQLAAAAMQLKGGNVQQAERYAEGQSQAFIARVKFEQNVLLQNVAAKFVNTPADRSRPKKEDRNKLFLREKRGIRSLSTAYTKTKYYRVHPKILFAIRNKEKLDQRTGVDGPLHRRSRSFFSPDYYAVVDPGGNIQHTVAVIDGKHVEISNEAERAIKEYEFASKVEEVSKKKKTLGLEQIESGFVNLVGDALSIAGPAAVAGAITKGVIAAIDAGFNFARFLGRQWQTRQGKKRAVALKYQGQVKGIDRSRMQKQQEYYEHAYFIMEEIGTLASPEEIVQAARQGGVEGMRQRYQAVRKYVEMTGVNSGYFYAQNGKPVKQVKLIVESLAER